MSLRTKLDNFVIDFLMEMSAEFDLIVSGEYDNIPTNAHRCCKTERGKGGNCCMKGKDHNGNCKFTPKGSMCYTTAKEFTSMLTGDEIKKLAGLYNVKTLKGQDNWIQVKSIIDKLFDSDKAKKDKDQVDAQEVFYSTDFIKHLSCVSENKCNCLTCGFCDKGMVFFCCYCCC